MIKKCEQKLAWILMDEVADHYFKDKALFSDDFQRRREGEHWQTEGTGTVYLPVFDGARPARLFLENVRFAPSSTFNVVSWNRLAEMGLDRQEDEHGNWIIFQKGADIPVFCCSKTSGGDCGFQWIWVRKKREVHERRTRAGAQT